MNSLDILCFTSVARTRSFSITARELLISQQAVSRHIKVLEDELGFPLFFRSFQSVQLTEAGKLMLQYYLERDSFIASYQKELAGRQAERVLNVGCSQWLGRAPRIMRLLERFAVRCPDVSVSVHELTAEEIHSFIKTGELDVLFTTRYASRFLPIAWNVKELREEPLFLLSGARYAYEEHIGLPHTFCGELEGEKDPESVKLRIRELTDSLGIELGSVRVLADMGSVFLDVLLRGGLAVVTDRPAAADNPDFALYPLGRTVTSVLCAPYQSAKPHVETLLRLSGEEGEP